MKWPTSLPGGTGPDGVDGVHQAAVMVGDNQLDLAQTAVAQAAEELRPEVLGLRVSIHRVRVRRLFEPSSGLKDAVARGAGD